MSTDKILYARIQVPMLDLSTIAEDIKNLPSKYGEILMYKDKTTDPWGIKLGDGRTTINNLSYLPIKPEEILIQDDTTDVSEFFKFRLNQGNPSTLENNTIYFIYE